MTTATDLTPDQAAYLRWLAGGPRHIDEVPDDGRPLGVHHSLRRQLLKLGLIHFVGPVLHQLTPDGRRVLVALTEGH